VRTDIGQLLWVGFHGTRAPKPLLDRLDAGDYGATILFKRNFEFANDVADLDGVVAIVDQLHRSAPDGTPALVSLDQEGGTVQRIRAPATVWPPMRSHDGITDGSDEQLAEQVGLALGRELRALGFDIDYAPVLDVHTNPANPVIGERAFATTAETVARRALAFARGLDAAGVLACGKHFPGHGDTTTDSHHELPRIDHAWDRLERIELLPFARAAAAQLPMVMTAHVVFAALDADHPATLSRPVITGLLREKLGFRGVIVSDDLDMKAIAEHIGVEAAAVAAIRAGCDVLLLCQDESHQQLAEAALIREAERDSELRRRISESAARVRAMKRAHADNQRKHPAPPRDVIGSAEHRKLADRLAGRA
jgi:beta-N-acetylhexosaminidase